MKRFFIIVFLISLVWACSEDGENEDNFSFEILPVATVDVPDTLIQDDVNRIQFTYNIPSNCHSFSDLYYIENGNERTIAVVNLVTDTFGGGSECEPLTGVLDERGFDFFTTPGFDSYIFNFWRGEDINGEDVYYTVEIPVE